MPDQNYTIVDSATGAVIGQTVTSGSHPRFHGFPWDGATMTAKAVDAAGDPTSERFDGVTWVIDAAKVDPQLHAAIDAEAGAVRCRFITDVPGQQLTYDRKEREARAWIDAGSPDIAGGEYPFLQAEASAIGTGTAEAAAGIIAAADAWAAIGSAIECARIGAKRAVTDAAGREEKQAAAAVDWDAVIAGALP